MNALVSGVSLEGIDLLRQALDKAFGESVIEIVELNKSNLRQRVHLGSKEDSMDTVLIVLDVSSFEECKDLKSVSDSDKVIVYQTVSELGSDLQSRYDVSLDWEEEQLEETVSVESSEDLERIEKLENLVSDKDMIINNLSSQIKDLHAQIDESGLNEGVNAEGTSNKEVESLKNEVLELRAKLSDVSSETDGKLEELEKKNEELSKICESLKSSKNIAVSNLESVSDELKDYKVKYSTVSGLLKSKESEVEDLKGKLIGLESKLSSSKLSEDEVNRLKAEIVEVNKKLANSDLLVTSKEEEILRLKTEISEQGNKSSSALESIKEDITRITEERDNLKKDLIQKESELAKVDDLLIQIDNLRSELGRESSEKEKLQSKLAESEGMVLSLNKEKIELESKLSVLEKSTNRDTDIETVIKEMNTLRKKYQVVSQGVFGRVAEIALPTTSLSSISVVRNVKRYDNLHFIFSGSAESRKGMYRCIRDKIKDSTKNILIVDVVSETNIDYVFQMSKVVNGMNWFVSGGGISQYKSSTFMKNVFVLSPGLTFVNDSYFLTIDWDKRLEELDESGYDVYVVCGDISNMVGRILHESFADCGDTSIYVHGNANGCRTIITNAKGLSKIKNSSILYYEFNTQVQKLYNILSKNYNCSVISKL